jgi:hypothetical protein
MKQRRSVPFTVFSSESEIMSSRQPPKLKNLFRISRSYNLEIELEYRRTRVPSDLESEDFVIIMI